MSFPAKCIIRALICLAPLLFASCLGMSMPKDAKLEPPPVSGGNPGFSGPPEIDRALVDRWELTHMVNNKGEEEHPKDGMRTLIEFMGNGEVIFNKNGNESGPTQSQKGVYSAGKGEMTVTDAKGNTSKWPYEVNGDVLAFTMPEKNQKFYWRRLR